MNAFLVVLCTVCCNLFVSAAYLRQPAEPADKKAAAVKLGEIQQVAPEESRPFYPDYSPDVARLLYNPQLLRELYESANQQVQQDEQPELEAPAKRAQTFVRFGKRAQTFVRFGKRAQTFVRFG